MSVPSHHPNLSRRGFVLGAMGLGATTALAACSSDDEQMSTGTLNVWGGVPPENGPASLVEAYNATNPDIPVSYTRFINDDRGNVRLDTALQGGIDIDVYFTYSTSHLALRTESGLADDITDYLESDTELADFLSEGSPRSFWKDGRVVALATALEPTMILLNESILDAAGVVVPEQWTMDDFEEMAQEIAASGTYGAYMMPDTARISMGSNYWYTESGESNFGDPRFVEMVARSRRLIDEGTIFPWTEIIARQLDAYQQNAFVNEEFGMWPTAPFSLRYLYDPENYPHDFRVAAAPIPSMPDGDWNTGSYNNFMMINPKSTKKDQAWDFMRFWVTEGSSHMAPGGKIPTLQNVSTQDMLPALLGPDADDWFDVDSFRRVLFDDDPQLLLDTELTAFPEIDLAVKQQHDLCWIGERSPEDAVAAIHSQASAAISRFDT